MPRIDVIASNTSSAAPMPPSANEWTLRNTPLRTIAVA